MSKLLLACAFLALSPGLHAEQWVVDDDGGVGVDFTTIQAAIDAAAAGDEVLVMAGDYNESIVLDKAMMVRGIGLPPTLLDGQVTDISSGQWARVEGLQFRSLELSGCAGEVFLSSLTTGSLVVRDCAIVRASGCQVMGWLACPWAWPCNGVPAYVRNSYVEFVSCQFYGDSDWKQDGHDGGSGLGVGVGATVQFTDSSAMGGFGGRASCFSPGSSGGGGHGVFVEDGGRLFVQGSSFAVGGEAGEACYQYQQAEEGWPIFNRGYVQIGSASAVDFLVAGTTGDGILEVDPFAPHIAGGVSNTEFEVYVYGRPGTSAHLLIGREFEFEQMPTIVAPRLVRPIRLEPIGVIPASGSLSYTELVPDTLLPEHRFTVQVLVTDHSGRRLSNSLSLTMP